MAYKELNNKLTKKGFQHLYLDPCAYIQRNGDNLKIITVWVDNLLPFASSNQLIEKIKKDLWSEWEITDLGEPAKIVGIEITWKENSITISQQKYIEEILKREGLENMNPVSMPMDLNMKLMLNPDGNKGSQNTLYARLISKLQFLMNVTRPGIAYAVNGLMAYTANLSLQHMGAAKQICLPNGRRSNRRSKKQTMVTMSSIEAEYVTLSVRGQPLGRIPISFLCLYYPTS